MRFPLVPAVVTGLALVLPRAEAAVWSVEFTNLPDVVMGVDLWRGTYVVSGSSFLADQGFTIYFDHTLYADLAGPFPPLHAGWDLLLVQPDLGLPDAGFLDGLATTANPPLADPFVVEFTWLGNGSPPAQVFELYDLAGGFSVIGSGTTVVVPEPQGALLIATAGLLVFAASRRTGREE